MQLQAWHFREAFAKWKTNPRNEGKTLESCLPEIRSEISQRHLTTPKMRIRRPENAATAAASAAAAADAHRKKREEECHLWVDQWFQQANLWLNHFCKVKSRNEISEAHQSGSSSPSTENRQNRQFLEAQFLAQERSFYERRFGSKFASDRLWDPTHINEHKFVSQINRLMDEWDKVKRSILDREGESEGILGEEGKYLFS